NFYALEHNAKKVGCGPDAILRVARYRARRGFNQNTAEMRIASALIDGDAVVLKMTPGNDAVAASARPRLKAARDAEPDVIALKVAALDCGTALSARRAHAKVKADEGA